MARKKKRAIEHEELFSKDPEIREKLKEETREFTERVGAYLETKGVTAVVRVMFGFTH